MNVLNLQKPLKLFFNRKINAKFTLVIALMGGGTGYGAQKVYILI